MAPNPQCSALAAAKDKSGLSYSQIANQIGQSEQHVIDVCTGKVQPTTKEFNDLATVLKVTSPVPNTSAHATRK